MFSVFNIECHLFMKHLSLNGHTHTLDTYSHILATPLHTFVVYDFISTDK